MLKRCLVVLLFLFNFIQPVFADDMFKAGNPDINKYEFARSYISALSFLKPIDDRWYKKPPKKLYAKSDIQMIRASINYLAMDNSDLRIAKNYISKYLSSNNALMRKVAGMFVQSTQVEIALNDKEKELWQKWGDLKNANLATKENEAIFISNQADLGFKRKENDKEMIKATVFMTKVLISASNANEKGHRLAISKEQREKLLKKLDSFGHDVLDWGLKPGQRTLQASIATIREVLEDSLWIASNEK